MLSRAEATARFRRCARALVTAFDAGIVQGGCVHVRPDGAASIGPPDWSVGDAARWTVPPEGLTLDWLEGRWAALVLRLVERGELR